MSADRSGVLAALWSVDLGGNGRALRPTSVSALRDLVDPARQAAGIDAAQSQPLVARRGAADQIDVTCAQVQRGGEKADQR
jgi:hypothetical protein